MLAATTRTSTDVGCAAPTRWRVRSCSTRRSLPWCSARVSPISSRKMVPPAACSNSPGDRPPPREAALGVAEHLALEQVGWDGRHVHRHERPVRARAQPMGGAGEQLLAGARLAGEENRQRRPRRALEVAEQDEHGRIARDDADLQAPAAKALLLGVARSPVGRSAARSSRSSACSRRRVCSSCAVAAASWPRSASAASSSPRSAPVERATAPAPPRDPPRVSRPWTPAAPGAPGSRPPRPRAVAGAARRPPGSTRARRRRPASARRTAERSAARRRARRRPSIRAPRGRAPGVRGSCHGDPPLSASPSQPRHRHDQRPADCPRQRRLRSHAPVSAALSSSTWIPTSDSGPMGVRRSAAGGSVTSSTRLPSTSRCRRSAPPVSIAVHTSLIGTTGRSGAQRSCARPARSAGIRLGRRVVARPARRRDGEAQRRDVPLAHLDGQRRATHDAVGIRDDDHVTDRQRVGAERRRSGLGEEHHVAGRGRRLGQQRVARRPPAPGTLGRPGAMSTPIAVAPARAMAVTMPREDARSHVVLPNRASLVASRATTTTDGLTGASAGTHASRAVDSTAVTLSPPTHTPSTATAVAASPIATASHRRLRRARPSSGAVVCAGPRPRRSADRPGSGDREAARHRSRRPRRASRAGAAPAR